MNNDKIAYRQWNERTIFYVASLPGHPEPKSDWGYVTKAEQAMPLSPYWQRRFAADCRRVGAIARFI